MRLGGKRMTKKLLFICLVSLVLVALFIPSCTGTPTTGTIEVKATLDGSPWTGAVDYTLTPTTGSPLSGTTVDKTFTVDAGNWTCAYVSGGPGVFVSITPSPTQEVVAGGTKTFTLNFITPTQVDASVTFLTWSINGTPVPPGTYWVTEDTIIDAEYQEHVGGNNTGQPVTVHQTNQITVHNIGIEGEPGPTITWHVVNAPGAVSTSPPSTVSNQTATLEGNPVPVCTLIPLPYCEDVHLDAECDVDQQVGNTWTKKINWVKIPKGVVILDAGDALFDFVTPVPPFQMFTLVTSACIEVGEGFVDMDPDNNCCADSPMLTIGILPPPP
jgi:hypothetical protein